MSIVAARPHPFVLSALIRRYHSFTVLVIVGLIAVGVSGLVTGGLGRIYGKDAIAGDTLSAHLSAARCADLREYAPAATTCSQAELFHHADEVVMYRVAMLPLGLLLAAAYWFARRRWLRAATEDPAVRTLRLGLGVGAFGLASVALLGTAAGHASTAGLARNLSDGLIALAVTLAFIIAASRSAAGPAS
ncbi:MAG TPA: hypothetical protein VEZ14_13615 [Dehalococcoidia bacterium]|nr:hypothetical protein [Dehalococcoidia bacterium]